MSLTLEGDRWILLIDWIMDDGDILRLSSQPYCTWPTDSTPNAEYIPCIQSVPFSVAASDHLHRSGGGADPISSLVLSNPGSVLDLLMSRPIRNTQMSFVLVRPGGSYVADGNEIGIAYGDRVETYANGIFRIRITSLMARLKQPVGLLASSYDLQNQRARIVLGDVASVSGERVSEAENYQRLNDLPWYGLSTILEAGVAVDAADYKRATQPFQGLDLDAAITGKLSITMRGSLWLIDQQPEDQLIANAQFSDWTSGNPDGWTVTESPTASQVLQDGSNERARFSSDGTALIVKQDVLTIGLKYYVDIECTNLIGGALDVKCGGATIMQIDAVGFWQRAFVATGTDITLSAPVGGCDVILESVRCYRAEETNKINHVLYHLISNRAGIVLNRINDESMDALATAAPWTLGAEIDGNASIYDVARQALDNVCGDLWVDLAGFFRANRLRNPAGETPVAQFDASNIIPGSVTIRQDQLGGLRSRIIYGRNFAVLEDTDIDASVSASDRVALKRGPQFATTLVEPNVHYELTALGTPRDSWIRESADATDQLDHEMGLASGDSPAMLVEWSAAVDPNIGLADLQPFEAVSIKTAVPTLRYGRNVLLLGISGDLVKPRTLRLLAWAPSAAGVLLLDDGGELLTDDGGGIALED